MAGSGTSLGFDADLFRNGIYTAMVMGTPGQQPERAIFKWTRSQTFNPQDPQRHPYDWNQSVVTDDTPDPVTLDKVAVEFNSTTPRDTAVGGFLNIGAKLTLLDIEYDLVRGADVVTLGGDDFDIRDINVVALFDVDVYEIFCERR